MDNNPTKETPAEVAAQLAFFAGLTAAAVAMIAVVAARAAGSALASRFRSEVGR